MAESKSKSDDAGQKEVQKSFDEAEKVGKIVTTEGAGDPIPNEEYSLQSGPESPTVAEVSAAKAKARAES